MKAILVIDMPKDCPMCPVAHYNKLDNFTGCDVVGGKRYAMTTEKGFKDTSVRPSWCPLKPLPKMKDVNEEIVKMFNIGIRDEKSQVAISNQVRGYNWCIDEILGEEK